jgi:hypothetical protein
VSTEYCHEQTAEEFDEFARLEAAMQAMDDEETRIDEARNELEGLLFKAEAELDRELAEFALPEEAEHLGAEIARARAWFEENEFERLPADKYLEVAESIRAPGREIVDRKVAYEELVEKLVPLVKELHQSSLDLARDLPHSDTEEYRALVSEISGLERNIEAFAAQPKCLGLEVPIADLRAQIESFRPRIALLKNSGVVADVNPALAKRTSPKEDQSSDEEEQSDE